MVLLKHLVFLFMVLECFPSSFSYYNGDPFPKQTLTTNESELFRFSPTSHDEKLVHHVHARNGVVNVDDFGAKGDGTDDSQAFKRAWGKACSSKESAFVVPRNKVYHLKPITFSGPCQPGITMQILGTIKASTHQSDYEHDQQHWILFENLQSFTVEGGGTINGNGKQWWENSCKINKNRPCKHAPTAMTFLECNNLMVNNLRIKNSQQMHMSFQDSKNVKASNLLVVAPEKSPNTDGIHITGTQNIQISSSVIRTGDDCVSIVSGSKNVLVTDLKCGPGHGISIGSLGKNKAEDHVSDVTVNRAILSDTTNGVRIKTWQGGSGYAQNIKFLNIMMRNVSNPIIIDQNYCDQEAKCPEQYEAVQVKDVIYHNIRGTSDSEVAINLDCSKTFPCQGIQLQNVIIRRDGDDGSTKASCTNVKLSTQGRISPSCTQV